MVVADASGCYKIYDPKENHSTVLESDCYAEIEEFLLEDEYDLVGKRFLDDQGLPSSDVAA